MVQMSYHFHVFSTTLHHSIVYPLHFPPLCNHNTPKIGANQGFFKGFSNFQSNCSEIRHTNAKNKKHLQHPPSFHFLKKGMLQILFHICYAVLFNFMHKRDYFSPLCSTCACFRPCFTCQIIIHAMVWLQVPLTPDIQCQEAATDRFEEILSRNAQYHILPGTVKTLRHQTFCVS